jgi:hypothetical protein
VNGGTVMIRGCSVDIGHSGSLQADAAATGTQGQNEIQTRQGLTISGTLSARNGENYLYATAPVLTGTIKPQANVDGDPTHLLPSYYCP